MSDVIYSQKINKYISIRVKGIRNSFHPSYSNSSDSNNITTYLTNIGEIGAESIYRFIESNNVINLGWRSWEGALPTTNKSVSHDPDDQPHNIFVWNLEHFPKNGNGKSISINEGDTIGFLSDDELVHSLILTDNKWAPANNTRFKVNETVDMEASFKFGETGDYYLIDPNHKERIRLKVTVMSVNNNSNNNTTDNNTDNNNNETISNKNYIVFPEEAISLSGEKHSPFVSMIHKNPHNPISEITGGEFYKGSNISKLRGCYVFSDLSKRDIPEGSLFYVKPDTKTPHNPRSIKIVHNFKSDRHYYVSLSSNNKHTKLYLGVYGSLGVMDLNLGSVYEISPHLWCDDNCSCVSDSSSDNCSNDCYSTSLDCYSTSLDSLDSLNSLDSLDSLNSFDSFDSSDK